MVELVDGKPPHGTLARIACTENVAKEQVRRLWQKFCSPPEDGLNNPSFTPQKHKGWLLSANKFVLLRLS